MTTMTLVGQINNKLPVPKNFDVEEELARINRLAELGAKEVSERTKKIEFGEESRFIEEMDAMIESEIPKGFSTEKSLKTRKKFFGW